MRRRRTSLVCLLLTLCLLAALLAACNGGGGGEPKKEGVSIYFMSHGGSRVETITARAGSPIEPPADPVREGYFFVGWYLTQKAAEAHATSPETLPTVMPVKSVTYHAGWSDQGAEILLDAGGGELSETVLNVAIGAKLTEIMRQYTPVVEEGVVFDGWYNGDVLIDDSMTVTEEGASLTAHYSAYYVVNIFKQGLDGQEALDEKESINELVPVGTSKTYVYKQYDGFKRTSDLQNDSRSLTVGMRAAENRVDVHYDRLRVTVNFLKGADGASGEESGREMDFGEELVLPSNPFTYERHRFAGWRIGANIFKEGDSVPEESMTVTDGERVDVTAIWDERFDDVGGGVDVLWLLGSDGVSLELAREELPLMTGKLSGSDIFSVRTEQGRTLRGKLMRDEGLFTWDLGFGSYVLRYVATADGDGAPHSDDHAKLDDPANSELYLGGETVKGSYRFSDADGVYIFTSDEDTPRHIYFSVVEVNGTRYFAIRENLLETYSYVSDDGDYFEVILLENGTLELYLGVKKPYWLFRERAGGGSYVREGENFKLSVAGNALDGKTVKIQPYGRTLIVYNARLDGTFKVNGGGDLRLDGFSGAVYTDGGGNSESGEFYVIDGEVVFFGQTHSLHFERGSAGFTPKGDFEDYQTFVTSDGAESVVINGHGSLRYVDYRGRTYYESYTSEALDDERTVLRFTADSTDRYYLVGKDGVATPTGAEVGLYALGGAKLRLDGLGGAVYEEGGQSYVCSYAVRDDAPYDYQLSGEMSFRFILTGGTFRKHDSTKYGDFVDKFDSAVTLFLDGYGSAELREGGNVTQYYLADTDGYDVSLTSQTDGEVKLRLLRREGATSGTFVRYDAGRDISVNMYDPSYFDDESTNLDRDSLLTLDGYDGVTLKGEDGTKSGSITSISSDGVYGLSFEDGTSKTVKLFAYAAATTQAKFAFAFYDAQYKLSLLDGANRLETDGYGILTYTPAEGEPMTGYYSIWGGIIAAKGGGFGDTVAYFSYSGNNFERCTGLIVDGGVVKRYIGEGGEVTLPNDVVEIARNAFKGSAVQAVYATRLDGGIGDGAFEGCVQLERIVTSSISSVGKRAFFGCEKLQEVTGADSSLQTIGDGAFAGCSALSAINLQAVRYIGEEAFAGVSVSVTLGAQNLQDLTICDRAFAHGDGVAPNIVWTSDGTQTPVLQGDPFAFDGEGEDMFIISVSKESQLSVLYGDSAWSKYAGFISFGVSPDIGEYFSVASLNKIHFEKITTFDNRRWTYNVSENGTQTFITYESSLPDRTLKLTVNVDAEANTVKMYDSAGSLRYYFVEDGAALSYTSEDGVTLSFTVSDSDVINAVFEGRNVAMARKAKTFDIGNYTFTVTLFADGSFAYSSAYSRQLVATYHSGDSEVGLYRADAEGTKYMLDGNKLLLNGVDGKPMSLEFASVAIRFESIAFANETQQNTEMYLFIVEGTTTGYTVRVTFKNDGTYSAVATLKYSGSSYLMREGSSQLAGSLVAYSKEGESAVSYVRLSINYGGETYDVISRLTSDNTLTIGEECPPEIRGTYRLNRAMYEATLTKVAQ